MALEDPTAFAPSDTSHNAAVEIDAPITSPALARLLDEVRGGDDIEVVRGYNRTYNRHNR